MQYVPGAERHAVDVWISSSSSWCVSLVNVTACTPRLPGWDPSVCEWYFSRQLSSESWFLRSCGVQLNKERAAISSVTENLAVKFVGSLRTTPVEFSRISSVAGFSVIQENKTTIDNLNKEFVGL